MAVRSIQKQGSVVIANGAAVSDAIEIPVGFVIVGIEVGDAWTAADIGFQISTDGGTTYMDVYSGLGTTTARARLTGIVAATWTAVGGDAGTSSPMRQFGLGVKVKLTSINTASNADVNQGADRTLGVWVGKLT